jgi:hypothetical protein
VTRVVIVLAAVGLLAVGCGGSGGSGSSSAPPLTKAEYQAQLQQISDQIGAELTKTLGTSKKLKQSDIPKLSDALQSFAGKIDALHPPTEVADLHVQLVAAMRSLADDLPKMLAALNSAKDPTAALVALFGNPSIQALSKLQAEFKAKGYDISSLLNANS